jgi:23S rRNA (uracil1939-C5)-methyltransferase
MTRRGRSPRTRRPARAAPAGAELALDIAEVGARGDGVASGPDGPVYVPFTLPGERVRARVAGERGELLATESPSSDRVGPPCPHFGRCGGCQLQHWADAPYLAWKQEQVVLALRRRGLEVPVEPTVAAWGEGRRRAGFHARRERQGVVLGFLERGGARIEPVDVCPVLAPALAQALPGVRALAEAFAPARGDLTLACLATDVGLDVAIVGAGSADSFDLEARETAATLADAQDLARLSFEGDSFLTRRPPAVAMGRARVTPPPGAFLQATTEGERVLGRLVSETVGDAGRVADLFSGVGTFALRLAERAEVHAVESDVAMLAALKRAADGAGGLRGVTVETRDLMAEPLAPVELNRFDAVVFDPPRAGAKLQAERIGASKVGRVAAVSCDPATFARDARLLVDAGFALTRVVPVDQFRWSPHVEVVGVLER